MHKIVLTRVHGVLLEHHNFAEDPEHQSHLEDEDGVEEPPVEREAEQGGAAAVVAQVRHYSAQQQKVGLI